MQVNTPLWPAGHLPHKGGDRMELPRHSTDRLKQLVSLMQGRHRKMISPHVGEMPGKAEGGIRLARGRLSAALSVFGVRS